MADYSMAMIMVDAGGPGKLPTYAGITYFYSSADYNKVIKPLWESGKLGGKGDVISPAQLKEIVGKPFSSRYGIGYEKKYNLATAKPKAQKGTTTTAPTTASKAKTQSEQQLKISVTKAPASAPADTQEYQGTVTVSKQAQDLMVGGSSRQARRTAASHRSPVNTAPAQPRRQYRQRRLPGIMNRRGRIHRQRRSTIV